MLTRNELIRSVWEMHLKPQHGETLVDAAKAMLARKNALDSFDKLRLLALVNLPERKPYAPIP